MGLDLKNSFILRLSSLEQYPEEVQEEIIEWSATWWQEHGHEPFCVEGVTPTGQSLGPILVLAKEASAKTQLFCQDLEEHIKCVSSEV